jgi:C4-dicarboxylate-specific signal transduction histidine kinase
MSDSKTRGPQDEGLGFWGAITASLSHEINNVFAIINELSGLLDDLFLAADHGQAIDPDKMRATTRRISEQVARGRTHVRQLNRLAHTVDHPRAMIAVNDEVEAIASLCGRFASSRRVRIETRLPAVSPRLEGSAFDMQHLVFRCIDLALAACGHGDVVEIGVQPHDDGVRFTVTTGSAGGDLDELEIKGRRLTGLGAAMKGTVEWVMEAGQPLRLTVSLPRSLSTGEDDDE